MRSHLSLFSFLSLFGCVLFLTSCEKDESFQDSGQKLTFRDPQSFTYSADSVGVGDSVLITFNLGVPADCGHVQIQVSGPDGQGWNGGKPVTPDSGVATLLFIPDAPGEYSVRAKYTRTGKKSSCDFESTGWLIAPDMILVGDDMTQDSTGGDTCEASFTGEVVTCDSTSREVKYTYVASEDLDHLKIQGGLTNGVDGDPTVTVDGADLDVTIKRPGHSSNRIITLVGDAIACDTIHITISWTSTNTGNEITGDWSASGGEDDLEVAPLICQ